jgi:hypothetical protein
VLPVVATFFVENWILALTDPKESKYFSNAVKLGYNEHF